MDEIGNLFLLTREATGISLKEVSEDLNIEEAILENIEDGKSGAFSDIFILKQYIENYAKYLGLDANKILDEFNEYIFESTSRIPIKDIEKQITENLKTEETTERVMSPYTKKEKPIKSGVYLLIYTILVVFIILGVFFSVKQIITMGNNSSTVNYGGRNEFTK